MIGLFLLERLLQRDHAHTHVPTHERPTPSRYFIVVGDVIHSTVDGVATATAFIANQQVGLITTLAVLAHEVPHQIGDYSILIRSGAAPRRAILVNVSSALAALLGVTATFALGTQVQTISESCSVPPPGCCSTSPPSPCCPTFCTHEPPADCYKSHHSIGAMIIAIGALTLPV